MWSVGGGCLGLAIRSSAKKGLLRCQVCKRKFKAFVGRLADFVPGRCTGPPALRDGPDAVVAHPCWSRVHSSHQLHCLRGV
eukprot:4195969-Pyramimonas_sp.AAC.1